MTNPPPTSVSERTIRAQELREGIDRLQCQISQLEAFDPSWVKMRGGAEVRAIQAAIEGALVQTFGDGTPEYRRYAAAARLDNGPMHLGGRPPVERVIEWIRDGKAKSLALLHQAIGTLHEELAEPRENQAAELIRAAEFILPEPIAIGTVSTAVTAEAQNYAGEEVRVLAEEAGPKFEQSAERTHWIQENVGEQRQTNMDYFGRLAGNIREAAHAFETEAPVAARAISSVADYVGDASDKMRKGNFRDLVNAASDFGKREPAIILGVSMLTAFIAFRLLKTESFSSSSRRTDEPS